MAEPLVTAAIPVHDGEAHLAAAIESVLAQTRPCDQIVVVDNASGDRSAEIARGFGPPVEVVSEPRAGIGFARNAAVGAARGDFISFLDADDLWAPAKTELQLAAFAARPRLSLVFGQVRQFASEELGATERAAIRLPDEPQPGAHVGAMLARRAAIEAVGPWPEDIALSDGLTFLLGARELGLEQAMLSEVVMLRRVHGANHSIRNRAARIEFARLLKGSLDRRRREAAQ